MIRQDARRRLDWMAAIKALENELDQPAARSVYAQQLDTIPGFGLVCSAELAGEIGTLECFRTESSFAFYLVPERKSPFFRKSLLAIPEIFEKIFSIRLKSGGAATKSLRNENNSY